MKVDKEFLKKHSFWIGLGCFAALWLVAILTVKVAGSDEKKKAWDNARSSLDNAGKGGIKTRAFQEPWKKHGKEFSDIKDGVWKEAWELQKGMYTWPPNMPVRLLYPDDPWGSDVNEELNNLTRFREVYQRQFTGLEEDWRQNTPIEFLGGFPAVFPQQEWNPGSTKAEAPTREEAWLAQENFWVRREMLDTVKSAQDSIARFKEEPADKKDTLPKEVKARKVFTSPYWRLQLDLVENPERRNRLMVSSASRITNLTTRTMTLSDPRNTRPGGVQGGIRFRLTQLDSKGTLGSGNAILDVTGEPLLPGKDTDLKKNYGVDAIDLSRPFVIDELFSWEFSPIRRIDALDLPHHSHRTITAGLKPSPIYKVLEPEVKEGDAIPGNMPPGVIPPGGMAPTGKPMLPPGAGPGRGEGGDSGAGPGVPVGDFTRVHRIDRSRYMHVTPQCRHLPLAWKVIVEQAHIHDLLTAIVNSRLRVQITQVQIRHATEGIQSATSVNPEGPPGSGTAPGPIGSRSAPPGGLHTTGEGALSRGGLGLNTGGASAVKPPPRDRDIPPRPISGEAGGLPSTGSEATPALVELTVYGVASLYERFPAKPAPKTPGTTPPGNPTGAPVPAPAPTRP
jgi:hypothetical protein